MGDAFTPRGLVAATSTADGATTTSAQTLTTEQQTLARQNISAAPSIVPAFYCELAASTPVTSDSTYRKFHVGTHLQTERYDTAGNFDPATGLFTVTEAGWYRFSGLAVFASGFTGLELVVIRTRAAVETQWALAYFGAYFSQFYPPGSRIIAGEVGDTFEFGYYLTGSSTATISTSPGARSSCWWSGERVA